MTVRSCESCGETFSARPHKVKLGKARYCSRGCYLAAVRPAPRNCAFCGATIKQTTWSYEAKYCNQACYRKHQPHPRWNGGRILDVDGYVLVRAPDNPMARGIGYVAEHRLVAAEKVGRTLTPAEVVHHVNGDKADNRPENLIVFASQREHMKHHAEAHNGQE